MGFSLQLLFLNRLYILNWFVVLLFTLFKTLALIFPVGYTFTLIILSLSMFGNSYSGFPIGHNSGITKRNLPSRSGTSLSTRTSAFFLNTNIGNFIQKVLLRLLKATILLEINRFSML